MKMWRRKNKKTHLYR